MIMIFSADQNWGIGNKGKLLYRASGDMKRFRALTKGKVVIMGHNTLLSLPNAKPLADRVNIVLSRKEGLVIDGAGVCPSLEMLLDEISRYPEEDVFVIGGEQIYKLLTPYCSRAYVTKFDAVFPADRFMENLDDSEDWKLIEISEPIEEDGMRYSYSTYIHLEYGAV
jgi:dihydrofolate reductase